MTVHTHTVSEGETPAVDPQEAEQGGPQRPDNVPEKFWDAAAGTVNTDALLASYGELESKLGGDTQGEAEAENPAEAPEAPEAPVSEEQAGEIAESAGIDMAAAEAHFMETGNISEDDYAKLEQVGITRDMVEEFIGYRVHQADAIRDEVLQPYGGAEGAGRMVEWAADNWDPDSAAAFNEAMESGDKGKMAIALRALKLDHDKAVGVRPQRLQQAATGAPSKGAVFQSFEQLMEAQRDPRYATDPAYRKSVMDRLSRSNI